MRRIVTPAVFICVVLAAACPLSIPAQELPEAMFILDGMDEPLPVGEGIEIKKGELLRFDTGL